MALPFDPTTFALSAAPSLIGGVTQLLAGSPPKTAYERELGRLSKYFGEQYEKAQEDPLSTAGSQAKLNMAENVADERRKDVRSQGVTSGATDEAKLAAEDQINENFNGMIQRILSNADREKSQLLNNYMGAMGTGSQLRSQAINERRNKIRSIFGPLQSTVNAVLTSNANQSDNEKDKPNTSNMSSFSTSTPTISNWA